jgi:Protein of unknown function (DUF2934)
MARKRNPENDLVVSAAAPVGRKTTAARPRHSPTTADIPASPAREPEYETPPETPAAGYEPSHEEISRLAFLYWEARGCEGGSPEEDWLRAEQELRKQAMAVPV